MKRIIPLIPAFLVALCLGLGIWMLVTGIGEAGERRRLEESFASTEGYFSDTILYSQGGYDSIRHKHTSPTYRLVYTYSVGGMDYTVATDHGTGLIPDYGTSRTVYYDPAHPENAVLGGTSGSTLRIAIGVIFTAGSLVFILGFCYVMSWLPKMKIDFMDVVMGSAAAAFGGCFLFLSDGVFHPVLLIPGLLTAVGLWLIIRGLFLSEKKKK